MGQYNDTCLYLNLILRLLGRVNDTVNKITYKMEENDPWYEEKTRQIENTEAQLKRLCGLAESLAQCRSDLASATGAFSQGAAMLSSAEEAHSLSRALAHLARVEVSGISLDKFIHIPFKPSGNFNYYSKWREYWS